VKWGEGASDLEFDVTDGSASVHVVSKGVPPQLFRDRIGVVVEGTMTKGGHFESRRLMVSHDNQYRTPQDKDVDMKTLMRSTQGLDEP
jgi:cytochrome c-type biogenesis protein CcmE